MDRRERARQLERAVHAESDRLEQGRLGVRFGEDGEIVASDVDGAFTDVSEMAGRLAQSRQVSDCMVRQWFRFAFGRTESEADACTLAELARRFESSGKDMRALIVAITTSDAFLYRTAGENAVASSDQRNQAARKP